MCKELVSTIYLSLKRTNAMNYLSACFTINLKEENKMCHFGDVTEWRKDRRISIY